MCSSGLARSPEQAHRDADVQQVPENAVEERGLVGAGQVEDHAGHPAAERHAEHGGHQHGADAHAGLLGREELPDDDGVGRHDSALEQTEQRRHDVQRGESVEGQEEDERQRLQARSHQQREPPADPIADEARGQAAHDAEAQHQRQHLRAPRRAVPEIAAVRDDVDLRHRHRDAAAHAGDDQHGLQRGRRHPQRPRRPRCRRARSRTWISVSGDRRRRASASGSMVATQKTAMPR